MTDPIRNPAPIAIDCLHNRRSSGAFRTYPPATFPKHQATHRFISRRIDSHHLLSLNQSLIWANYVAPTTLCSAFWDTLLTVVTCNARLFRKPAKTGIVLALWLVRKRKKNDKGSNSSIEYRYLPTYIYGQVTTALGRCRCGLLLFGVRKKATFTSSLPTVC